MQANVVEQVEVRPWTLAIERPRDPEALLDEDDFARDEFLPYWAELWPSGLALARHVASLDTGRCRVLELGCGLALPSLVAALGGATVLATDWADEALELARRNARQNGVVLELLAADWRRPDEIVARGPFDLVLAADVLYEKRNAGPLLALLSEVVAAGGAVLVADPGRHHADAFVDAARATSWNVETTDDVLLPRGGIHRLWKDRHAPDTKS